MYYKTCSLKYEKWQNVHAGPPRYRTVLPNSGLLSGRWTSGRLSQQHPHDHPIPTALGYLWQGKWRGSVGTGTVFTFRLYHSKFHWMIKLIQVWNIFPPSLQSDTVRVIYAYNVDPPDPRVEELPHHTKRGVRSLLLNEPEKKSLNGSDIKQWEINAPNVSTKYSYTFHE